MHASTLQGRTTAQRAEVARAGRRLASWAFLAAPLLLGGCQSTPTSTSGQQTFASPTEAFIGLLDAARAGDVAAIEAIFGAENKEVLATGDASADRLARQEFCAAADERVVLARVSDDRIEVRLGEGGWPAPVPIVCEDGRWYFDTGLGVQEILNRRIGRNELEAIHFCRSYLDAQYIYRYRDWDGDGVHEFAQVILSKPGGFDGLYWEYDEAGEMPLCPLDGLVTENEAYVKGREAGAPWFGYYVRVLIRQGPGAPGGAKEYLDGDNMTGGFALVVWPAKYDATGVMSFVVSHQGTVYEKDLGSDSAELAVAMEAFDPSDGWTVVE